MATANELVIKINGDIKNFNAAMEAVQKKTEDVSGALSSISKVSAVAFAALTAEIGLSVHAFAEAEESTKRLTVSLQNQGMYTSKVVQDYKDIAKAISLKTGVDDDAIVSAQATIQSMIGQTEVTKEMTQAIVDYAAFAGTDLNTAASLIGKTIGTATNAFARHGLQLSDTATTAERTAKTLEFVSIRAEGMAEAANKGIGGIKGLQTAFGNVQEEIGARFAPMISVAIAKITDLFNWIGESPRLLGFVSGLISFGTMLAGLIATVSAIGVTFISANAAAAAFGLTTTALLGPIGLVVAALALVATGVGVYVGSQKEQTKSSKEAGAELEKLEKKLAKLEETQTKLVADKTDFNNYVKSQFNQKEIDSLKKRIDEYKKIKSNAEFAESAPEQDPAKKKQADKLKAQKDQENAILIQSQRGKNEILRLEEERAGQEIIDLKSKQNETIKAISATQNAEEKELLKNKLDELKQLEEEAALERTERERAYFEADKESRLEMIEDGHNAEIELKDSQREQLISMQMTENDVSRNTLFEKSKMQIEANNQYLKDQAKFGTTYATINRAMHSEVYQGTKQAFGEMQQMQSSQNATLKSIGKAAAVANIIIKTAESAMSIYAGFSTIPIIGPALGVAGAAAAVAFGAEQVGRVTAAADGGLLTGGIPGVDSIPVLAQRNELISPAQSFEEVIGSVRAAREAEKYGEAMGAPGTSQGGSSNIMIGFDGKEASQVLTVRQIEDRALGVSQQS